MTSRRRRASTRAGERARAGSWMPVALAAGALFLGACGEKASPPEGEQTAGASGKPETPTTPAKPDPSVKPEDAPKPPALKPGSLKDVEALVAKAKSSEDFLKIITACGEMEIAAAATGAPLREEPAFIATCRVAPTKARAALAIADSAGDRKSPHCLSASMNLEELVKAGVEAQALGELLGKVNAACGL